MIIGLSRSNRRTAALLVVVGMTNLNENVVNEMFDPSRHEELTF